jgi:antibiotic biosynthesis monooxygenase (ABM) superfamily enzyme
MARPLQARAMVTVAAWLAAFLIVTVLFLLVGDELQSLPLVPRALIISGVLVGVMVNVVMPRLTVAVGRFDRSRAARARRRSNRGSDHQPHVRVEQ